VGIIVPVVIAPSIGVDVPVNVGVIHTLINGVSIDVAAVNVAPTEVVAVNVTPVDVAAVNVTSIDVGPVDIAAIDVTSRSVSDSRPGTASASRDAGLRYTQPHAAHKQNRENYNHPSHGFLLILKRLFLPIYSTLRLQSAAWGARSFGISECP
jgi:hypothetical protein